MGLGLVFFLGTVLGVHRFPDCYTRMHGAAKGDTLSSVLFIFGILLVSFEHADLAFLIRSLKLLFIVAFIFVASPAASHALVAAGFSVGVEPWQRRDKESDENLEEDHPA
jgi:multicomponent Na+:H+ antiporter subunit G